MKRGCLKVAKVKRAAIAVKSMKYVLLFFIINSASSVSYTHLNWSLSMMLHSGLTAYESLKICGKVIANRLISTKLTQASEQILTGKDLASSLKHSSAIPDLVTQMMAVGEKTGTLDLVLREVGAFYEHLLEVGVKRMSALIEPAMILVIGGIVGFVYYAFFQAMFSLVAKVN